MAGIEKSIELYELIIKRLEESGVAPNQLEYYHRCLDLIRTCSTAEEAELAMRKSPLFNQGGQALMLDKLIAYKRAMEYCMYDDAAEVYGEKFEEMKENYASAWDTAYVDKVMKILEEYAERKYLFTKVAFALVNYLGASELSIDSGNRKMDDDKLKESLTELQAKGLDFFGMAGEQIYRELVPLNDEAYSRYIGMVRESLDKGTMAQEEDAEEYARIKKFASAHRAELLSALKNAKSQKAVCLATPNEDAEYKYDFLDRAEEG